MLPEPTDRNVYILGAGFSASAGAPLIYDFLDRAREFYDNPTSSLDPQERDHFRRLFDFKRSMAQAREKVRIDLDNIEQLFGLVEISHRLGETTDETRNSTVYLIAKTLQLATTWPGFHRSQVRFFLRDRPESLRALEALNGVFRNENSSSGRNFTGDIYEYFAALVSGLLDDPDRRGGRKDTVVTFNYDLVLDHALLRIGTQPEYSLRPELVEYEGHPHERSCDVLKIHGSTNWAICTKCHKNIFVLPQKVTDAPNELRSRRCPKCDARQYLPLLVPPSWDKSEYREIMEPVWKKAVDAMKSATRICFIGYSMPQADAFFKYLLTLALSQNFQLYKFIVIDYEAPALTTAWSEESPESPPERVVDRYRNLLETLFQERRFSFHKEGFAQYFANSGSLNELGRGDAIQEMHGPY